MPAETRLPTRRTERAALPEFAAIDEVLMRNVVSAGLGPATARTIGQAIRDSP